MFFHIYLKRTGCWSWMLLGEEEEYIQTIRELLDYIPGFLFSYLSHSDTWWKFFFSSYTGMHRIKWRVQFWMPCKLHCETSLGCSQSITSCTRDPEQQFLQPDGSVIWDFGKFSSNYIMYVISPLKWCKTMPRISSPPRLIFLMYPK